MTWLIFTMMSATLVTNVDHKQFKSYTECVQYIEMQPKTKPKSCFTQFAKFKQPKKAKK